MQQTMSIPLYFVALLGLTIGLVLSLPLVMAQPLTPSSPNSVLSKGPPNLTVNCGTGASTSPMAKASQKEFVIGGTHITVNCVAGTGGGTGTPVPGPVGPAGPKGDTGPAGKPGTNATICIVTPTENCGMTITPGAANLTGTTLMIPTK